jgi:hypothetical protein
MSGDQTTGGKTWRWTDIAKELRSFITDHEEATPRDICLVLAAAEIERLQADKAAISQTASDYLHEIERLQKRLDRMAAERIDAACDDEGKPLQPPPSDPFAGRA